MGSGIWSTNVYDAHRHFKAAAGKTTFDYSDHMRASGPGSWRAHPTLDPLRVKSRESRDSAEHPNSTSIAVLFDVTGSMGHIPVVLQKKLPELLGLLLRKGYVTDPQILFGAIGDATCDRVPLQVGQFESDNRMDENLENMFLEGGGGGQRTESYELAMYFMARHTEIDCWEKHGRKGYLFIIGDEMAYPEVKSREVQAIIGDGMEVDIATRAILKELSRRYHVFYILPRVAIHGGELDILDFWRGLLGQHVLQLADPEAVCETIALTIGMMEGTIDLPAGIADLEEYDVPDRTVKIITTALSSLPATLALAKSTSGALPGLSKPPALVSKLRRV